MNKIFQDILCVGFDIDKTLYSPNKKMDSQIQIKIARKILDKKPELINIKKALEFSERRYSETGSRSITLKEIGYSNPEEILYDCLVNADITPFLKRDSKLEQILENLRKKYSLFLMTNNPKDLAIGKLDKMAINPNLFEAKFYGDTAPGIKKADGSLFKYFLKDSKYTPKQILYVGDSRKGDIIPARDLGMKTLAVGSEIPEADFSIKKIYDIEEILL